MFQYTTNFVIYAARSEQYRKAYIHYIKTTLPWLFDGVTSPRRHKRPGHARAASIFIINPVVRRSNSSPQLTFNNRDKSGAVRGMKVDMKLEYSLDLKFENVLSSCNFALTNNNSIIEHHSTADNNQQQQQQQQATIIILPTDLNKRKKEKKTRFFEIEEDEFNSEVDVYSCYKYLFYFVLFQDQAETNGVDKEFRSEYSPSYAENSSMWKLKRTLSL